MAYNANNWQKGDKITSARLNHIEAGIQQSSQTAEHNAEDIAAQAEVDIQHTQGIQEAKEAAAAAESKAEEARSTITEVRTSLDEKTALDNAQNEDIETLRSAVDELSSAQSSQSSVNATQTEMIQENAEAIAAQAEVDAQHTQGIQTNANAINTINETLNSLNNTVSQMNVNVEGQAEKDASQDEAIQAATTAANTATETVAQYGESITDLTSRVESAEASVAGQAEVDAAQNETIAEAAAKAEAAKFAADAATEAVAGQTAKDESQDTAISAADEKATAAQEAAATNAENIGVLDGRIETVETAVADKADASSVTSLGESVAELSETVAGKADAADLESKASIESVTSLGSQLEEAVASQATKDTAQDEIISGLQSSMESKADASDVTSLGTQLSDAVTAQASKDAEQNETLSSLQTAVSGKADAADVTSLGEQLGAALTAQAEKDEAQDTTITNAMAAAAAAAAAAEANAGNISVLGGRLDSVESKDTAQDTAIESLQTAMEGKAAASDVTSLGSQVSEHISAQATKDAAQDAVVETLQTSMAAKAAAEDLNTLAAQVTAAATAQATKDEEQDASIHGLQESVAGKADASAVETLGSQLSSAVEDQASKDEAQDTAITTAQATADAASAAAAANAASLLEKAGVDAEQSELIAAIQAALDNYILKTGISGLIRLADDTSTNSVKHEIITKRNNKNVIAKIWNETSGGGLQLDNQDAGMIAFLGINDGAVDNDIWAQFYGKNKATNVGTRMNFTNHGVYLTENRNNGSYTEDDHLVVKRDIASKADVSDITMANNIVAIMKDRLAYLEAQVSNMKKTNVVTPSVEDFSNGNLSQADADIVLTEEVISTPVTNVVAQSLELEDATLEAQRLAVTTTGDVTLNNVTNTGVVPKATSNSAYSLNSSGDVRITGMTFEDGAAYNAIEIGLGTGSKPTSVLIKDCDFKGSYANNVITVFNTADNAVITIENCHFAKVSNAIRLSNKDNVHVTLNLVNCTIDETEPTLAYHGAILLQDYTSPSAEAAVENNLFGPDKVTINFVNTSVDGVKLTSNMAAADICATGTTSQVLYCYCDKGGLVAYSAERFPVINIA